MLTVDKGIKSKIIDEKRFEGMPPVSERDTRGEKYRSIWPGELNERKSYFFYAGFAAAEGRERKKNSYVRVFIYE